MKCINLVVHLLLCASLVLYEGKANAQTPFLNKDDARKMCDSKEDKLLSYNDIKLNKAKLLEERLDDEETIWIEDYAEYSRFISYVGCYKDARELLTTVHQLVEQSSLFMCLKACTNPDIHYIGFLKTICYCIFDSEYLDIRNFVTSDQHCDISRDGLFNKKYNPKHGSNMIVYKILPQQYLDKISVGKNKSQCVYAKIGSSQKVEYITGSCSWNIDLNGCVCTQSAYPCRANNSCQIETFDIQQKAKSLLHAELQCQKKMGILHKIPISNNFPQHDTIYLTGTFRVFEIRQLTSVCLSVRKSSREGLVIEPGDCSINKSSFCHNDVYTVTTSDFKSQFPDEVSTTNYFDSTTITNLDKNNDNNPTTVYMIIILSLVCIVVVVTICFLYRHFKERNTTAMSIAALTPDTSAIYLQPNQTDNTSEHEYAIPSTHNEDDLEQVAIPKKPQRKALRKPAPDSSYENFVFGVASNRTEKSEPSNLHE